MFAVKKIKSSARKRRISRLFARLTSSGKACGKSGFLVWKQIFFGWLHATVYVYEDNYEIQGFIGMNSEYIEGIFISEAMQSQGIGKILLNYVKDIRSKLLLNVYQKNIPAISFYQREGFEIQYSGMDEATGEKDYVMVWQQK